MRFFVFCQGVGVVVGFWRCIYIIFGCLCMQCVNGQVFFFDVFEWIKVELVYCIEVSDFVDLLLFEVFDVIL